MVNKKEWLYIICCSFICLILVLFRVFITQSRTYFFLNWNLFLAILPFIFTSFSLLLFKERMPNLWLLLLVAVWLIFFPNAPYILTDLVHLNRNLSSHVWYDLIMILFFSWTGLMAGFFSLRDIEKQIYNFTGSTLQTYMAIALILFLTSFGVYLGRYLRFNSWDLVCNPVELVYEITHRFINPFQHSRTWGVTVLFGFLLNVMYLSFKLLNFNYTGQKK